jgi:hypothetical protein
VYEYICSGEISGTNICQYSGKENPYLEQSVDDRTRDLTQLIEEKYLSSGKFFRKADFARIAQFYTLDVISDVAFGAPLGFLERLGL